MNDILSKHVVMLGSSLSPRCVDMVKSSQYVELANDLEINKAITYLRQKDFNQVSVFERPHDGCIRRDHLIDWQSFSSKSHCMG